jgi:neurexin
MIEPRVAECIHSHVVFKIIFKTEQNTVNLIELALNGTRNSQMFGDFQHSCQSVLDPVTFNSPDAYIPIYAWKDYPKLDSFTIEFQTNENHGVLAYVLGSNKAHNASSTQEANDMTVHSLNDLESLEQDFFALELHNRFLNAYINYGKVYYRHEVVHEHVSSGRSHQLTVDFDDKYVTFKFDQQAETMLKIDSFDGRLDLDGPLVIGGVYPKHRAKTLSNPSTSIPPYFYSGMLNHGYVGCIQDVVINNQYVNLTYFANSEQVSGISRDSCNPMPNQCETETEQCLNGGTCLDGWNRFICDCSSTGFNGPICNQRMFILFFLIFFHFSQLKWVHDN